jgi:hypothetical protein
VVGPVDFRTVQDHFGLAQAATAEKDWHVMRAKQAVAAVDGGPSRLVFAGGTALARAHKRVRRMSKDIAFKIVPIAATAFSGNKQRQHSGDLRDWITANLNGAENAQTLANLSAIRKEAIAKGHDVLMIRSTRFRHCTWDLHHD